MFPVVVGEGDAPPRLSPRGSFALWRETIHGYADPWDDIAVDAASNLRKTLLSGVRIRASELRSYNQRLLDADPFAREGLVASRTLRRWDPVIGPFAAA